MTEEPRSTAPDEERPADPDASIADGIRDVISTTLDIGASVAKMVAEATSGGRAVAPPRNRDPINGIVHYSVASVVNVVTTVATSANQARNAAVPKPAQAPGNMPASPAAETDQRPNLPTVHRGATLRIPLSIENPGAEPMDEMAFACLEMRLVKRESEDGTYSVAWLRFEPQALSIAPNDFEKLTVFIDTPDDAALGHYQTSIGVSANAPVAVIDFYVIENAE